MTSAHQSSHVQGLNSLVHWHNATEIKGHIAKARAELAPCVFGVIPPLMRIMVPVQRLMPDLWILICVSQWGTKFYS
jgi:hypothetical protein